MKSLGRYLSLSLLIHLLLLILLGGGFLLFKRSLPLAGGNARSGGGGEVVTVSLFSGIKKGKTQTRPQTRSLPFSKGQGTGSGEGIGPGSGLEGSDTILARIRSQIERAKRYPELASRSGIFGKSLVSFQIDTNGLPKGVLLKNSSGSKILDEESLSTIRRAAPFPAYPEPLEIWISFQLSP